MIPGRKLMATFKYQTALTDDGMGNKQPTLANRAEIEGVFATLSGDEQFVGGSRNEVATHMLFIPYSTSAAGILPSDVVVISGKTYQILYIDNPGGLNRHYEIKLRIVE